MIKTLSIHGLRSYSKETLIDFSQPNGELGGGLTFFVGANNSGKTTAIEALQFFNSSYNRISFSEGKRNAQANHIVHLGLSEEHDGVEYQWSIHSAKGGGSSTTILRNEEEIEPYQLRTSNASHPLPTIYVLQSRRFMEPEFGMSQGSRDDYLRQSSSNNSIRRPVLTYFESRLFQMWDRRDQICGLIDRAFGRHVDWQIDQRDSGQFFLKFRFGDSFHSLDGAGDGLWNVFVLCDSLYDAEDNSTIVLDEPEQSLHPQLQKRVMKILKEESRTKQIVISTHSPYFIDWESLANGGKLIRFCKENEEYTRVYTLGNDSMDWIKCTLRDVQKPHTLGLNTRESFFLDDGLILCEGQDDVVMLRRMAEQIDLDLAGEPFGWGAAGADNIPTILKMLNDLGFKKVVAIFDANKTDRADQCKRDFPQYSVFTIPTDDIRDKRRQKEKPAVNGLVTQSGVLKNEYIDYATSLLNKINYYLKSDSVE